MTDHEAMQLLIDSYDNYSKPDEYQIIEALKVLVDETKDPLHMVHLGSLYREAGRTDLALKYYTMAETLGNPFAYICLGQMWQGGEGVPKDLKKAFEYYSRAAEADKDLNAVVTASCLVADMYKDGEYVEKDYGKYCEITEDLYKRVKGKSWKEDDVPISEVLVRIAEIRAAEGKADEAIELMLEARETIAEELEFIPTPEVLSLMERVIGDLYGDHSGHSGDTGSSAKGLIDFDPTDFGLFDLYHLLMKEPRKVRFGYDGRAYEIKAVRSGSDFGDGPKGSTAGDTNSALDETGGRIEIEFDGKWYRSVKELLEKAFIGDDLLVTLDAELYGWEVCK